MMEHIGISIYYAETDGAAWAAYFQNKLSSQEYGLDVKSVKFTKDMTDHSKSANLNLVFISPDFLDIPNWDVLKTFNKDRSIAVLTGIDHDDIEQAANAKKCDDVLEWYMNFELEGNEDSVRELLILTIDVYEGIHLGYQTLPKRHKCPCPSPVSVNEDATDSNYDRLPSPRQVNAVHQVFHKDDKIYVLLERPAEGDVGIQLENYSRLESQSDRIAVYVFQYTDAMEDEFSITMDNITIGKASADKPSVTYNVINQNRQSASREQPTKSITNESSSPPALYPKPPHSCYKTLHSVDGTNDQLKSNDRTSVESLDNSKLKSPVHSKVEKRDENVYVSSDKSKLEQIRELLEAETDPEQMLCRCLGIDKDIRRLDEKMKSMVECAETLKHLSFPANIDTYQDSESSTWPTLLHLGAQYNLMNFCDALLSNPLMYEACIRRNKNGHLPHDLAKQNGHMELAILLQHFSTYVMAGKERKYDSGCSGCSSELPRLSTITLTEPPAPHSPYNKQSDYMTMNSDTDVFDKDELYANEEEIKQLKLEKESKKKTLGRLSVDKGLGGSFDEDNEYLAMSEIEDLRKSQSKVGGYSLHTTSTPIAQQKQATPPFKDMIDLQLFDSHANHGEKQAEPHPLTQTKPIPCTARSSSSPTLRSHRSFDDENSPKHKNLSHVFGVDPPPSPQTIKKKTTRFFTKWRHRTHSDSVLQSTDEPSPIQHRSQDFLPIRDSASSRSSNGSSSHSSTYSDISSSSRISEIKEDEVQHRRKTKNKSKKKLFKIMQKAKKRDSVRIKTALKEKSFTAPSLPEKGIQEYY